jgi:hypothetical protein
LEGGTEGSGPGDEVITDVIFAGSPFGSDKEFRRCISTSGIDIFSI